MSNLSQYATLPKKALKAQMTLPLNVFVHLPQNQSIIHFRKIGDVISDADLVFINKIAPSNLLLPVTEMESLYPLLAGALSEGIRAGEINTREVKESATEVLNTFSGASDLDHLMKGVSAFVEGLVLQFKNTPSVSAYEDALRRAAERSGSPLTAHHQQVSSVAVLMGLSAGDFSMDDLADIAAAGLVHDLGLSDIPQNLMKSHLSELKKVSSQEKVIYMRHIELTLERIKKDKINMTPGMQRIVELHHENWDGSGFRAHVGNRIFRPARVLRLADDLVSVIQDKSLSLTFHGALEKLKKNGAVYDPALLTSLLEQAKITTAP